MHKYVPYYCIFFIVLGWIPKNSVGQFQRYGVEDGLIDRAITAIHQDKKGFIWIGTQGTLYLFDGIKFTPFTPVSGDSTALSHNFIYTIKEDLNGFLWIGTRGGGLNKFDPITGEFYWYKHDSTSANSISHNDVRAIHADKRGIIWIGTNDGILQELDPLSGTFKWYPLTQNEEVEQKKDIYVIYESPTDSSGLWIGRADGLFYFNRNTKQIRYYKHDPDDPSSLSHNVVYEIFEDTNSNLWIGTGGGGLSLFDRDNETFKTYKPENENQNSISGSSIPSIVEDKRGMLWIGTYYGGLNKFNPHTEKFERYIHNQTLLTSLSHNIVTDLILDKNGLLWVGTYVGLNTFNPDSELIETYNSEMDGDDTLSSSEVLAVAEDKWGNVWIGTSGGGLNKLNRKSNTVQYFFHQGSSVFQRINIVFIDSGDRIWIGPEDANLYLFDPTSGELDRVTLHGSPDGSNVRTVYESALDPGILWIGTSHSGLYRYHTATRELTHYIHEVDDPKSLSNNYVTQIYIDRDGLLWIATLGGGLNLFNAADQSFHRIQHNANDEHSLSSDDVLSIYESQDGSMWFGTTKSGLNRYDRTLQNFSHFNSTEFPFTDVGGIEGDRQGRMWLSTSNGIFRFDPATGEYVRFGTEDGLQGILFRDKAHLMGSSGELYFGGINGLNIFDPRDLDIDKTPAPLVLTDFSINENSKIKEFLQTETGNFELDYDENYITFEFALLNYKATNQNQYRYILEDHEKSWVNAGNSSFARYSNLAPDDYVFKVEAADNNGVWNRTGISIPFKINPPWWQRTWFRLLILMLIGGIIYALDRYRLAKLLEMERMRLRIASDIHDDLGGELSSIAVLADMVQRRAKLEEIDAGRMAKIVDTAKLMVGEIRDIIWLIAPEHDNIDDLISKMQNIAAQRLSHLQHSFSCPENLSGVALDMESRRHFLLCYKEILHNIVKHAEASKVEIELTQSGQMITLSIKDNGRGIDAEMIAKESGNGLKNLRMRAQELGGRFEIKPVEKGTHVLLTIKNPENR